MNRLKKYFKSKIESGDLTDDQLKFQNYIQDKLTDAIKDQYEKENKILIEALKYNGYSFESNEDLLVFVSENLRVDYQTKERTVFYLNGNPFLERIQSQISSDGNTYKTDLTYNLIN